MNKIYKILFTSVFILFLAGTTSASLGQYWKTQKDIIPRTNDEVEIGSSSKRVKKIWTKDMDSSGVWTLGGNVGPGGLDFNGEIATNIGDIGTDFGTSGELTLASSLTVGSDILSDTADTDNLGSSLKEFANLYIGDNGKIYLGIEQDTNIQRTSSGVLTLTATNGVTTSANLTVTGDLTISGDDLTMTTNTTGSLLVADGTNFNPVVMSGNATIGTTGAVEVNDVTCTNCLNATEIEDIYVLNSGDQMTGELTMSNDIWIRGRNQLNTDNVNMFKITTSDAIEVGGTLLSGNFEFTEDSGATTLADMPVSATPTAGDEESYTFKIDGNNIMTIYSEADSSGGIQNSAVKVSKKLALDVDARTIADSGDGNPATFTLEATGSFVRLTCNDAHTCDVTMSETNAIDGVVLKITNATANVCDFADTAGVSELAGAFAMGIYDTLELIYSSDRWIEISRSNN